MARLPAGVKTCTLADGKVDIFRREVDFAVGQFD
jgi:hypothetical protein